MRSLLIAAALTCFTLAAAGQGTSKSNISQLPNGTLAGNVYSNDTLGLSYEFPASWTATADPKGSVTLVAGKPDALGNQCSKVLMLLSPPNKVEGRFSSVAALFAFDPACLSGAAFPQSLEKDKLTKVADKMIKMFRDSPFLSPYGAAVSGYSDQGRVIVQMTGGVIVNAIEGPHPRTKDPLDIHTSLVFTEANGYWVAWGYSADDPSTEALKNVKLTFKPAPLH